MISFKRLLAMSVMLYTLKVLFYSTLLVRENNEKDHLYIVPKTEFTIDTTEHNGTVSRILNCKANMRPFDNSAEFIFNNVSREHIAIVDNICITKDHRKCNSFYCGCNQTLNEFRVNFTMTDLRVGQILGCQMRFLNEDTGDVTKIFISKRFNGTDFKPLELNIKMNKKENNTVNTTTDKKDQPKSEKRMSDRGILITSGCIAVFVVISGIIAIYLHRLRKREESQQQGELHAMMGMT
ncbi:unnamed protein product [Mytilus coruscus]|uniref:Uncharacterized protein n=1 Tax=Mytilus coruscus TaxID=42192 RepID=A0A6J8C563_MYTCO|nr:unnamed protein product [Mytilus coruscus]